MPALHRAPPSRPHRAPHGRPALPHRQQRGLQRLDELQLGCLARLHDDRPPRIVHGLTHRRIIDLRAGLSCPVTDLLTGLSSRIADTARTTPGHREQHPQVGCPGGLIVRAPGARPGDLRPVEHHRVPEPHDAQPTGGVDQQGGTVESPVRDPDRVQGGDGGGEGARSLRGQRRRVGRAARHERHDRDGVVVRGAEARHERRHGRDRMPRQHLALRAAGGPGIRNPHLDDHRRPRISRRMRPEHVGPLPHRHEFREAVAGHEGRRRGHARRLPRPTAAADAAAGSGEERASGTRCAGGAADGQPRSHARRERGPR